MNNGSELLNLYLTETYGKRGGVAAFAKETGIAASLISRYRLGTVIPEGERPFIIEKKTNGRVPANSWFKVVAK